MSLRYLFLLATASLLIPVGSAIALGQLKSGASPSDSIQTSSPIMTQVPPGPPPMCPPPIGEAKPDAPPEPPWAKEINLSTEQRERIKAIHEQEMNDTKELREQLVEADKQMRSLLEQDASPDQLKQQHQQIQTLHQQLDNKHFEVMLAERQVLSAEQRAQLAKLMQQHQGQR